MKRFVYFFPICCIFLLFLTNCNNPSDTLNPGGGTAGNTGTMGTFTCLIDGRIFKASTAYAYKQADGITIVGCDSAGANISLSLNDRKLGQHTLAYQSSQLGTYRAIGVIPFVHSSSAVYGLNTGDISLTGLNATTNNASGTFHFYAYNVVNHDSVKITEGIFSSIPIYDSPEAVYSTANFISYGSLNVLRNGTLWTPPVVYAQIDASQVLTINGKDGDLMTGISITMPLSTPPGTYTIDSVSSTFSVNYAELGPTPPNLYIPLSGTLFIEQNNPLLHDIKGTFNADLKNAASDTLPHKVFTNGAFKVRYVQ